MPDRPYVCVFCGSSSGARPVYEEAARRVGATIARRGLGLVYGGGRAGLMGTVADAVLDAGGPVIGVIPDALADDEIAHRGVTELHVVAGMHERKALMASRASCFVTLPGGIGTYEEFFEILTWAALDLHRKPMGLLNVNGYFDPLLAMLRHGVAERFVRPDILDALRVDEACDPLMESLCRAMPGADAGWVDLGLT